MSITLSDLVIPVKMTEIAGIGSAIGAIGSVTTAIIGTTAAAKSWADELDGLATKTGLTADEAAGMALIAKETGIDIETASKSVGFMNKGLVDLDGKLGPTGKALSSLGVEVQNVDGSMKSSSQILQEAATKIQAIQDPAARARAEMAIFGKAGTDLDDSLGALANGGLSTATEKAREMGLAVGGEGVASAEQMQMNMADLQMTLQGLVIQIGSALIPILNQFLPIFISTFNQPAVKDAITAITTALAQLLAGILPLIPAFLPLIVAILPALTQLFTSVIAAILPLVMAILPPLISLAVMVISALMPLINAVLPPIISLFTQVIVAIMPLIMTILPPLITLVINLISSFMPIISAVLPVVITLFSGLISILIPIINLIFPVLTSGIKGITDAFNILSPVITTVAGFIGGILKGAFDGISTAIGTVIGWIDTMIEKFSNIQLPSWLTPGSPTPFELGLRGINDAMSSLNSSSLPDFNANLDINKPTFGTQKNTQASAPTIDYEALASVLARTLRLELQTVLI